MLVPLADTITPLLTAGFVYLFILNAVIGILEGKLLKRWFNAGPLAVWWMIAANYLSAWVGWFALIWFVDPRMHALLGLRPIERINSLTLMMVFFAFMITIIVEVGFVHFATRRPLRTAGRTFLATLCVNAVSYVIICLWFLSVSFSLPFNARVRPLSDLGKLPDGVLYWVDPTGQILARDLNQPAPTQKVGQVIQNDFVKPYQLRVEVANNPDRVQLSVAYSGVVYADRAIPANLETPVAPLVVDGGPVSGFPADYWGQSHILRKNVLDTRPRDHRQMRVNFDWYRRYLDTELPSGFSSHLCVAFATREWMIQEPTVLPDDKIVFEWSGQIVLFDPHTQKLAFVALGSCPAFVPSAK